MNKIGVEALLKKTGAWSVVDQFEARDIIMRQTAELEFKLERPDCFEFAMDFLGDPEESEVGAYVGRLERELEQVRNAYNALRENVTALHLAESMRLPFRRPMGEGESVTEYIDYLVRRYIKKQGVK